MRAPLIGIAVVLTSCTTGVGALFGNEFGEFGGADSKPDPPPVAVGDPLLLAEVDKALQETASRQTQGMQALYNNPWPGPEVGMWHYSNLALASYWLNQDTSGADATFQLVMDNGLFQQSLQAGGFHWVAYLYERMYFLFSSKSNSPDFQGRMSIAAEDNILEMLWDWSYAVMDDLAWANQDIGYYWQSENHHAQKYVSLWGAAHVFKDHVEYKDRVFSDGTTPAQQASAFDAYFKDYVHVYTFRGLAIEAASPFYAKYLLNTWYNLYDFADDTELKEAAGNLLNVYWANWGMENLEGIRGGSRHRNYPNRGVLSAGPIGHSWYLFGEGGGPSKHPGDMSAATTSWKPAPVVVAIALDVEGRGSYVYKSRRLGLLTEFYSVVDLNGGSLVRYSWCTPDFVMGMSLVEARSHADWIAFSSQNRWNGIVFADHETATIFTQRPQPAVGSSYNAEWGVQHKGVMILQRLTQSKSADGQMIWFDDSLNTVELDGWLFGTAPSAYAAVKIVSGSWTWEYSSDSLTGWWATLDDQFSPIIMEVGRRADYGTMESFQAEILSNPVVWDGAKLEYTTRGYDDATLTLFTDESASPQVNGVEIDFAPDKVYDSPYLDGRFGNGPVTIEYEGFETLSVQ